MKKKHLWTASEIKKLITIWDDSTLEEICDELRLTKQQISYIRIQIKKAGYKLTNKRKVGRTRLLIEEVLASLPKQGKK